jgi:circadian clock protein KaiC
MTNRVQIRQLPTGVPGLDAVLGGGIPEFSFNLIAGGPGCGKTTMAHQILFANATDERKALYFTVFGEPPIKMLRYQQQFAFFDASKINSAIRFVHLGEDLLEGGMRQVSERIEEELEKGEARTVIVDSFRSVTRVAHENGEKMDLERFVQLLALKLTSYEATTFLVGEYLEQETNSNPVFTVADGIVWLHQSVHRNSAVRLLQVVKVRGQSQIPGLHAIKLTSEGMRVFPRVPVYGSDLGQAARVGPTPERKKTGVPGLDTMLGGGIPASYSILLAGPAGSGKTMLSAEFLLEGIARGEAGVIAIFERRPHEYLRTNPRGAQLERAVDAGQVKLVYLRPLDLSVDETLEALRDAVAASSAKRVVIDSLSGFELALAPAFREDFRESLYRLVDALTTMGVTVLLLVEATESIRELRFNPPGVSFLTDGIILQRYLEIEGDVRKQMAVIKLRGSAHRTEFCSYEITSDGLVVNVPLREPR